MKNINYRYDVINHISKKYGFTKYLEIGVRNPNDCFNHINIESKQSVDPGYEVTINTATYKFTSDKFFEKLHNGELDLVSDYQWDIIFVDGLHLAPQVYKDILNSLQHISSKGVVVLHDVNPFLYESMYTRMIEDYHGQAWNGTVWKPIYQLRTERSDLSICTLNIDEGIGLIKKGSQELIPHTNKFFEYKELEKDTKNSLNTLDVHRLDEWLESYNNIK